MKQYWLTIIEAFKNFDVKVWAKELVAATPPALWSFKWVYLGFLALLLIGAIVILFLRRMHPPLRERWSSFFWSNLLIGLVLFFMRDQRIPYLGTNLLRVVHEFFIVFWLNSIIWYKRTGYRQEKVAELAIERKSKYLPKAKN